MKKIKLEVETLEIESFPTAPAAEDEEGTVFAYATRPNQNTCGGQNTCADTCGIKATCVQDCYWTVWETCNCPVELETARC